MCGPGGAAALGSPYGGAGERSETERAQAVANLGKVRRLLPGTLSVTATPCQLSLWESQGAGDARPAHRNYNVVQSAAQRVRRGNPAAQPPLAPLLGELASEARLRGRRQWQIWENAVIVTGYPLSHDIFSIFATAYTLSVTATPCQLSQRESQGAGAARPAHRNFRSVIWLRRPPSSTTRHRTG